MNEKSLKLLKHLEKQDNWITSSQLSAKLDVSVRTIKSYILEIKQADPKLIISSKDGYKLNRSQLPVFLKNYDSLIPQTPQERIDYVIIKLIKSRDKYINIYDLSREMYISEATLKIDLHKIRAKCSKFDLTVNINGDNISIEGFEKNKRKMMSSIIYGKLDKTPMSIPTLQSAFADYDVENIEGIISNTFKKYHLFINDYSLYNLILHITITIDRIKNNYLYEYIEQKNNLQLKNHEYEIAREILGELEKSYNIKYNEHEIYELTLQIISSATNLEYKNINKLDLEKLVGRDCMELVGELIEDINDYYYIEFNDPEFLIRFSLHIKNLLTRIKSNYFTRNPLTDTIKSECPLIYDCAVNISYKIKKYTSCEINDDEIAYIALHIGGALVNHKNLHTKITCAILFPHYYDLDIKLTEDLHSAFGDSLLIRNIITTEKQLEDVQVDFIISTIQFSNPGGLPFAIINPFLTERDKKLISNKIEEIKKNKQKLKFLSYMHSFFNEMLFIRNRHFEDEGEAIEFMCSEMKKQGYINSDFKQEVLEREAMSSTAFNGIAIPHSMKMSAQKTGMFVIVNEESISWGKKQVNIIFLLAINRNEKNVFHYIFDSLATILSEELNLKKLISCNSYEEFIITLVNCI